VVFWSPLFNLQFLSHWVVSPFALTDRLDFLNLPITFRGFAQRGFQGSIVSKVTKTSKQRDAFLEHQTPRCAKPLL